MSKTAEIVPFDAIAQYVGAHENFSRLSDHHKLFFYALFKTFQSPAPSRSFLHRTYLFICAQTEYQKWLAWWTTSQKYTGDEAVQRYCAAATDIDAYPPPNMIEMMRTSGRGKGFSQLSKSDEQKLLRHDMDHLIEACHEHATVDIEKYLGNGGSARNMNEEGTTLLHFAVDADAQEIVELLISRGADIDAVDDQGMTALDSAILNEFEDIVVSLKAHSAKEMLV